jgi:multidrug resistance efflux pump
MRAPFTRSLRSLADDTFARTWLALLTATLLIGAWSTWFIAGSVPIRVVSSTARLEVHGATYPLQAPVTGQVISTSLVMGRRVSAGDVLVELDATVEHDQLAEEHSAFSAAEANRQTLDRQIEAEGRALAASIKAADLAVAEARARVLALRSAAELAEEERSRIARLRQSGLVSEVESMRAASLAQQRRAETEAAAASVDRLQAEAARLTPDHRVRVAQLRQEQVEIEGQIATQRSALTRARHDVERYRISAPSGGELAEVVELRVGTVVKQGEAIATVLAPGDVSVTAYFLPDDVFGRIRPGQPADVRLTGFSWAEFGVLKAVVSSVAGEVRDGLVRVNLTLRDTPPAPAAIPRQHGLPGTVEVEIETLSPARLLLRTLGDRVAVGARAAAPAGR